MKKYKFILFSIISILILFPACEEALDFQNDGRITMDQVFKDRRKIQGYLNSCYNYRMKQKIQM
jgi:hypothetical protein